MTTAIKVWTWFIHTKKMDCYAVLVEEQVEGKGGMGVGCIARSPTTSQFGTFVISRRFLRDVGEYIVYTVTRMP